MSARATGGGKAATGALIAAVALWLIAAAPATASTIGIEPNVLFGGDAVVYRAAPGELNQLFPLGLSGDQLRFQDGFGAVAITPLAPCARDAGNPTDTRLAQCPAAGIVAIAELLGDGADIGDGPMNAIPVLIDGGADNDTLTGGDGNDLILGGSGDDRMLGGAGDDVLDGGPGADELGGTAGAAGDTSFDVADYGDRVAPLSVTLDGVRNDGEAGENDLLDADMDGVNGGAGADTIVGDAKGNLLIGNDGNDTLDGGDGADVVDGGNGDDTILARDGVADQIDCGAGTDSVTADATDVVVGCESVSLPPAPAPAPAAPVPAAVAPQPIAAPLNPRDTTAPALVIRRIRASRLRTAVRRGLRVPVVCSEACTVRAIATFHGRRVARGNGSGAAGLTRVVRLRFTKAGARSLRRRRTVRLTLRVTATDPSGNRRTVARTLTLRR